MKRGLVVALVCLLVGIGIDLLVGADPPGYAVTLGLAGCVGIILIAKWLGGAWLERPERYYEGQRHG